MHDLAAVLARARADVDDPVGGADGVFVVLDDDERVAEVLELDEGVDEAAVVALVQADARLVEHVEHAGEAGADLGREADALRLAAGERRRRARQVEVAEADLEQELEPQPDLAQHLRRDLAPRASVSVSSSMNVVRVAEAELGRRREMLWPSTSHREHLGLQPLAVADRARDLAQVLAVALLLTSRSRPRGTCARCRA